MVICHKCYKENHCASDRVLTLRHQRRNIQIYEQLKRADRMSVRTISYHRVRTVRGAEDKGDEPYHSASYSSGPYPRGSNYCNLVYALKVERHPRSLTSVKEMRSNK